uniref:Uncharacterized protein n=1 Tax=Sipha flava TaxID=143950 RepID=A0A2S2QTL3_9HEMI
MNSADGLLSQDVLKPEFQKNCNVPVNDKNSKIIKRDKKRQEVEAEGENFADLPTTNLTDYLQLDLYLSRIRYLLDNNIGRYVSRERICTIIDKLFADVKFKHSTKKRNRNRSNPKLTAKIKRDNKKMKNLKKKKK